MINTLNIEGTEDTPKIILDPQNGIFEIAGRSFPEDASRFYQPIISWVDAYTKDPCPSTSFCFNLEYFNSTSAKQLLEILLKLERVAKSGNEVKIIWSYDLEDDLMAAKGQEIQNMINIPFELRSE